MSLANDSPVTLEQFTEDADAMSRSDALMVMETVRLEDATFSGALSWEALTHLMLIDWLMSKTGQYLATAVLTCYEMQDTVSALAGNLCQEHGNLDGDKGVVPVVVALIDERWLVLHPKHDILDIKLGVRMLRLRRAAVHRVSYDLLASVISKFKDCRKGLEATT